jgi:glycosyltransferase involved in cell wall biosynthesis
MSAGTDRPAPRRVVFVGSLHVGVETVFRNVAAAAAGWSGIDPVAVPIASYERDRFERLLPFLPASMRGTLRYLAGTRPLFDAGRVDAVWSLLDIALLPWMVAGGRWRRVPVIYASDSTPRQLRAFGAHYGHWGGRSAAKFAVREVVYRRFLRRVSAIHTYTRWAADSFQEEYGVPADRIHVLPPGVDTSWWTPPERRADGDLPRLLFVGGDFERKGGDLLLDVFRARLAGRAELDVVTREPLDACPGVRVHLGLRPNDERLRRLYQSADLLVIPTRADCFSMAGLEAMSCGVPVVTCPVGGVGEVFNDGVEGVYVPADDGQALGSTLHALLGNRDRRLAMGVAARQLAVRRYDAASNTGRLLALIMATAGGPAAVPGHHRRRRWWPAARSGTQGDRDGDHRAPPRAPGLGGRGRPRRHQGPVHHGAAAVIGAQGETGRLLQGHRHVVHGDQHEPVPGRGRGERRPGRGRRDPLVPAGDRVHRRDTVGARVVHELDVGPGGRRDRERVAGRLGGGGEPRVHQRVEVQPGADRPGDVRDQVPHPLRLDGDGAGVHLEHRDDQVAGRHPGGRANDGRARDRRGGAELHAGGGR